MGGYTFYGDARMARRKKIGVFVGHGSEIRLPTIRSTFDETCAISASSFIARICISVIFEYRKFVNTEVSIILATAFTNVSVNTFPFAGVP